MPRFCVYNLAMRILVIEDNEDAAESLQLALQLSGHTVDVAFTGADGVAKAQAQAFEVVVCDIGLPDDMDGYAVARALAPSRKDGQPLMIAMTGYGRAEDKFHATNAGFDHHLVKPVDPCVLEKLIDSIGK
jgi:DNA-binding response OmpR family regulator